MSPLVSVLVRADRAVGRLEWVIAVLCMSLIFISTGLGVFSRYVLNDPLIWANDVGVVSMTWAAFVGGSALYKERGHIAVDALDHVFPARVSGIVSVVMTILMGGGIALIGWQMLTLLPLQHTKLVEALGMPRSVYGIPLAWAAASIAFSSVRQLVDGSLFASKDAAMGG